MNHTIGNPDENLDEKTKWQAVLSRNPLFQNAFVYAVRSTGIYCLPTCPSRRPQQQQVEFFDTAKAAEEAGYRPCKRCHPQHSISSDEQIVADACKLLEQHTEKPLTLNELSTALHVSPFHLHRVFKSKTGLTPKKYAAAQRLKQFKNKVKLGESVASAMYGVGYGSSSRLYEDAEKQLGMTPAIYRKGGKGMEIKFTISNTSYGKILVAGTQKGLCCVCFGETDTQLENILIKEYPAAQIQRDDKAVNTWTEVIIGYLNNEQYDLSLPLDLQATAFQLRVWDALRKIPYGSTRSYSEVARSIGQPKAARAVASACARNPVALVTPCHRVVNNDGKPGKYRWGEARKRALLSIESQNKPK